MSILVDTSIWSLILRRKNPDENAALKKHFQQLIVDGRIRIIGPIRQEILSGISNHDQFLVLKDKLQAFEDINLQTHDYEVAAEMFNICRKKGVQGSHIDFLICAAASNYELKIFTTDKDFLLYNKHLPINIYEQHNQEG